MKFIKNNLIFILIIFIGIFILKFKLPYYIEAPGGLENLEKRYKINNEYKSKGSFNLTYVSEYDANIPMYIYVLINKDFDIVKKKESIPTNSTYEEEKLRGKLMYKDSIDNAIIASYKEANKSTTPKTNFQTESKAVKSNVQLVETTSSNIIIITLKY